MNSEAANKQSERLLEWFLCLICLAMACLIPKLPEHRLLVFNLFFLPIVLSGFVLGRYRAGVLSLLAVLCATIVIALNFDLLARTQSPLKLGMEVTVWAGCLGLCAILTGTLSDERRHKLQELTEAHVGVVEVLLRYLQGTNTDLINRSTRTATLSKAVAKEMKLSAHEAEDIRVAALLADLQYVQITTRVIKKAVGGLSEGSATTTDGHTFHGSDLISSLGQVLSGAFPLLDAARLSEEMPMIGDDDRIDALTETVRGSSSTLGSQPMGTHIIEVVREYIRLTTGDSPIAATPGEAIQEMRALEGEGFHPAAVYALEAVVQRSIESRPNPVTETNAVPLAHVSG